MDESGADAQAGRQLQRSWECRASTAALFGRYVTELRLSDGVALDGLAGKSKKTPAWLRAIERGELLPTREMVSHLNVGFGDALASSPNYELENVYLELLDNPLGTIGSSVRSRMVGELPTDGALASSTESAGGLLPLAESVSLEDRLLVFFPAVVVIATAVLSFFVANASNGWGLGVPGVSALLATGALLAATVASLVQPINAWLSRCTSVLASAGQTEKFADIGAWAEEFGLPLTSTGHWYQPGFAPHMIPSYREDAMALGLAADLGFRLSRSFRVAALIALLGFLLSGVGSLEVVLSTDLTDYSAANLAIALVAVCWLLASFSQSSACDSAARAHATISDGLGLRRGVPKLQVAEGQDSGGASTAAS